MRCYRGRREQLQLVLTVSRYIITYFEETIVRFAQKNIEYVHLILPPLPCASY